MRSPSRASDAADTSDALSFDFCPSLCCGKLAEQQVGDDEAEHRVAEELQRLVVEDAAAGVLVHARAVRQRVLEQPAILEAIADAPLERLELGAERHDAAGPTSSRWLSMMRGAPASAEFLAAPSTRSSFSESGNGVRAMSRGDDRRDAVRVEQAADDVRLDLATACGR